MKSGFVLLSLLVFLAVAPTVGAQVPFVNQTQPALMENTDTAPNLYLGLAGIAGGLAAVFISGGLLYSAFGGVGLAEDLAVVKYLQQDYQRLRADPTTNPMVLATAAKTWNEARDDTNRKTAFVYLGGFFVYTAAAGLIAAFFAGGLIDAFVIGLGWTGAVSTLASRYNISVVQERKDEMSQQLLKEVEKLNQDLMQLQAEVGTSAAGTGSIADVTMPIRLKHLQDEVKQVKMMGW